MIVIIKNNNLYMLKLMKSDYDRLQWWYNAVYNFHKTFNHPTPEKQILIPESSKLRHDMLKEEVEELKKAYKDKDIVEFADAIADILYLAIGGFVVHGAGGGLLYGAKYAGSMYRELVYDNHKSDNFDIALKWYSLLTFDNNNIERFLETEESINVRKIEKLFDSPTAVLHDIINLTLHSSFHQNIGIEVIDALFYEVHRSNMSKLDENGNPIYNEQGKVMKSKNYVKPDIKGVLNYFGIDKWQ